jgi:ABC-type spermidine/putrescine transport system permease subunit I
MSKSPTGGAVQASPVAMDEAVPGRSLLALWPALPGAVVLVLLFIGPMAFMIVFSLWRTNVDFDIVPDWNLDNYLKFFTVPTFLRTFGKTALMAAGVTLGGLAAALPFTYYLVRYVSPRWQRLVLLAVIVPFWTSYLLRVYAWQAILGEQGALNQLLMSVGLISQPSRLLIYNDLGVFIVLLYVYFPFAALALYASLERFDFAQVHAAQDLGARPDQAIRHVLLPQIRPGIVTACLFVFIPIFGEFLTPTLVGGPQGSLIGNLIVYYFKGAQISQGAAIAILIALFVTLLLVFFRRYLRVEDVVARG